MVWQCKGVARFGIGLQEINTLVPKCFDRPLIYKLQSGTRSQKSAQLMQFESFTILLHQNFISFHYAYAQILLA